MASEPNCLELWQEDQNLQNWFRGDSIAFDDSMVDLGSQASDEHLFFHLNLALKSMNHQIISELLHNNNRIFSLIELLTLPNLYSLSQNIATYFPIFIHSITYPAPQTLVSILEILAQSPSVSKKRKSNTLEETLENDSSRSDKKLAFSNSSIDPKVDNFLELTTFYRYLRNKSHDQTLAAWNKKALLREWFLGNNIRANNKTFSATDSCLKEQVDLLIISEQHGILFYLLQYSARLIAIVKNIPYDQSVQLLYQLASHASSKNLRKYLNMKIHMLPCIYECSHLFKNSQSVAYILKAYLKHHGFYQSKWQEIKSNIDRRYQVETNHSSTISRLLPILQSTPLQNSAQITPHEIIINNDSSCNNNPTTFKTEENMPTIIDQECNFYQQNI